MKGGPPGGIGDTPSKLATQFTGSGEGQETPHTSLPGNTSTLGEDSGKSAKPGEFRQPIAPTLRTSRDDSESEGLAGRPEHVSGAGAAEFPLTAQTYFCDSRSPLRDLPLPLQPIFFILAHRSAPAHQIFGPLRSAPAPVYFKQQTEKWTDFYRASSYDSGALAVEILYVCLSVRPSVCLSFCHTHVL